MAKFGIVVLLVPALLVAAGLGLHGWLGSSGAPGNAAVAPTGTPTANARRVALAADERRRDEAVLAYMKARDDPSRRKEGLEILAADVTALGSAANRSSLPLMLTILERGEPELRAAAAHAIGMIGPTPAEVPALMRPACYFLSLDEGVDEAAAAGVEGALLVLLASLPDAGVVEAELDDALLSVLAAPAFSVSAPAFSFSAPAWPFRA